MYTPECSKGFFFQNRKTYGEKIIETKVYYNENKDINNELRNSWKDIIRVKRGGIYKPENIKTKEIVFPVPVYYIVHERKQFWKQ